MNLLSIAAALGVVVAIFEHHWFTSLTGIEPAPITSIIPVTMFAIVFGLSMDYEVFLISRIHEEWQHRHDPNAAIRKGITTTARVITAAAAVMIAVFVSVGLGGSRDLELAGIALAVAVFLDAFVIRTVLLPAVLFLLGRHAWYLPARLNRRLPRLAIEPPTQPPTPLEEAA
jgi:RND superfamily putative drug exporter